ncbi:hypothetical protein HY024_00855 [Candidatus Curtissbacteria bacterium]|nr:hypothetical protein [Candidatus Curtissbacteria bacterium]
MLIGTGALGAVQVYAQSSNGAYPAIVQKLVDKFHLNPDEVKSVFDQNRQERTANRQQKLEDRLSQLVKDGKISQDQKQKILAKLKELQANRQANLQSAKSMTPEQRKAAIQKERDDLKAWAQQNGIDLKNLMIRPGFGFRGHWGF